MAKYMCICGIDFTKKQEAELHVKIYKDLGSSHTFITKHWRTRLLEWFLNLPGRRIARCIGVYFVYIVLIKHFHIEWSMLEAIIIGIGLGLAID